MNREEMFRSAGIDTTKMHTEELFRQTGRTWRMLMDAVKTAKEGHVVLVVMKDMEMVDWAKNNIGKQEGIEVVHYNPISKEPKPFSWETLEGVGKYINHRVFIDHDVIYFNNRKLFEAASKYDPKVDIKEDTMTFIKDLPF